MSMASNALRRVDGGYAHFCPACGYMHKLPDGWQFDGSLEHPTFTPSFKHSGKQITVENGKWAGGWVRGADGNALDWCCHYILTAGVLNYCGDCTHAMAGQAVPLPPIPDHLREED